MCRIEFTNEFCNDYDFIILHVNKSLLQQIAEHDAIGEGRGAVWSFLKIHINLKDYIISAALLLMKG